MRENSKTKKDSDFEKFFDEGGFAFMKQLERDFSCAGMCRAPLFFIDRDITLKNGLPTKSCDEQILSKLNGSAHTVGYIALSTGIVALTGFVGSFPLCTPDNEDEDLDDDDRGK